MNPLVTSGIDYLRSLLDTAIKIPMAVAIRNCLRALPVAPTDSVPPEVNALHTTLDSLGGDPYLRPLENPREALVALVDFVYCQGEDFPAEAKSLCLDAVNSLEPDSTEAEIRQRLTAALQGFAEALVTRHKERLSR